MGNLQPKLVFVILAVGEVLKRKSIVTAEDVKEYIFSDDTFSDVNIADCHMALNLMEGSGFINQIAENEYRRVIRKW